MWKIFPSPFRLKDWVLTVLALAAAAISVIVSGWAGYGGGVVLFFCDISGAFLFVAMAGSSRVFYTALFSAAIVIVFTTWSTFEDIFVDHNFNWRESLFLYCAVFLVYLPIPVGFSWLLNWFLKRRFRASKS